MRRIPNWAPAQLLMALRALGISQSRFHHEGNWYHPLERFPAAYCMREPSGFVMFRSERDFVECKHLLFGKDVHTQPGITIASMPGFVHIPAPSAP